jgi:hypothetical protein
MVFHNISPELKQSTLLRSESNNLTTATLKWRQEEAISSIDHHFPGNDSANNGDLVQDGFHRCPDPDVNTEKWLSW